MKKVISVLLLVVLVSVFAGMAVSADAIRTYLKGDADGDGEVTVIDATRIQRVLVNLDKDEDGMSAMRGDVTGDELDILDATAIQRYLVGFENIYAINTTVEYTAPTEEPTIAPVTDEPTAPPTEAATVAPTEAPTEPETQGTTDDPNELPFVPISNP